MPGVECLLMAALLFTVVVRGAPSCPLVTSPQSAAVIASQGPGIGQTVAVGQLDGDALPDIAVPAATNSVLWFRNTGLGTFSSGVTVCAGTCMSVFGVAIGDVAGNGGALDIVAASPGSNWTVAWFLNDGTGVFGSMRVISLVFDSPGALALGDLNGDGTIDIVTGSRYVPGTAWFANLGGGAFAVNPSVLDPTLVGANRILLHDFNGDGRQDIMVTAWVTYGAYVQLAQGAPGSFAAAVQVLPVLAFAYYDIDLGDVNNDGVIDVAAASFHEATIGLFLGLGGITFGPRTVLTSTFSQAAAVRLIDLEGDGDLDVVGGSANTAMIAFLNAGNGVFNSPRQTLASSTGVYALMAADMNADGLTDLVTSGTAVRLVYLSRAVTYPSGRTSITGAFSSPDAVAVGDLDLDGGLDVVAASQSGEVALFPNANTLGSVTFASPVTAARQLGVLSSLALYDYDDDGLLDVFVGTYSGMVYGVPNLGARTFGPHVSLSHGVPAVSKVFVRFYDLALSGKSAPMLVFPNTMGHVIWCRPANATLAGLCGTPVSIGVQAQYCDLAVGDIDGDGDNDLLTSMCSSSVTWMRNLGAQVFGSAVTLIASTGTNGAYIALADLDADGDLDVTAVSLVASAPWWVFNGGGGVFGAALAGPFSLSGVKSLVLGDADNDGDLDMFVASDSYQVLFYAGGFNTAAATIGTGNFPTEVALADFNADGTLDVAVVSYGDATVGFILAVPSVRTSQPTLARRLLPVECGGVVNSLSCLLARTRAAASACFTGSVTLTANVSGCLALPATLYNRDTVTIRGAPGLAITINCTSPERQSLFVVGAGAALALESVSLVAPARAGSTPGAASMLSVCTAACGATDDASLVLRNVTISGFANSGKVLLAAPTRSLGAVALFGRSRLTVDGSTFASCSTGAAGGAIALVGADSSLVATRSVFTDNVATGAASDAMAGGGAVALVGARARAQFSDCRFERNIAASAGGGALAAAGEGAQLELTRCVLSGNSARALGSGGAVALVPGATGASVALTACTIVDCVADAAGGAVSVSGADGATLSLAATSVSGCSATFGGSLAAIDLTDVQNSPSRLARSQMPFLPRSAALAPSAPRVVLDASSRVDGSSAVYGGLAFACGGSVNVTAAGLDGVFSAAVAGGLGFVCLSSTGESQAAAVLLPAVLTRAVSVSAGGYGPSFATPPASIDVSAFAALVAQSGAAFGSASRAVLVDGLGQTVHDPSIVLRLALSAEPAQPTSTGGTALALLAGEPPVYEFGDAVVRRSGWPASLGEPVTLVVALDAGGVQWTAPGAPLAQFSVSIGGCARGWGRISSADSAVPLVCSPCGDGTSSTDSAAAQGAACVSCPALSRRTPDNGTSAGYCVCAPGAYLPDGAIESNCAVCPTGATCAGGFSAPVAAPGFYPEAGVFVACVNSAACVGSGVCARGYHGRLCGLCSSGYYALNGQCRPCNLALAVPVSLLFVFGLLALLALLLWLNLAPTLARQFVAASIALMGLQTIALFGQLALDWGPFARAVLAIVSVLSLNLELTSPECSLARGIDPWLLRFGVMLALPVFVAAGLALVALVLLVPLRARGVSRVRSRTVPELAGAVLRTWFQMMLLLYLPITATAFSVFACRHDASGTWTFLPKPAWQCFDARWWRVLFGPGLAFTLLYGVGAPVALWIALWRVRARTSAVEFQLRYSFAVARFRDDMWAWEAVNMAVKFALVAAVTVAGSDESKAAAGAMVLVALLVALSLASPYARRIHRNVALVVTAAVALVIIGATLGEFFVRRLAVNAGIVLALGAMTVGNVIDMVQIARADKRAERQFAASKARGSESELGMTESVTAMELSVVDTRLANPDSSGTFMRSQPSCILSDESDLPLSSVHTGDSKPAWRQ